MKKLAISMSVLLASSFIFVGCGTTTSSASPAPLNQPGTTQKSGNTTKTGTITQIGEKFYISQQGKQPMEIDSNTVDLKQYLGKTVTITGQFSGDTLYVGKVE